jgi:hypothetical protein
MVIGPIGSWIAGNGFWVTARVSLFGLGCIAVAIGWYLFLMRGEKNTWYLTDNGLQRVKSSGDQTTINWEQIRDMKWLGFLGFMIRWNKPQTGMDNQIYYRDVRSNLGVGEQEARELISLWREKRTTKSHAPV